MAIKSMTGFGRGEAEDELLQVVVELSVVNRKQFDCNISWPRDLLSLDVRLQGLLRQKIARGYIKGVVTVVARKDKDATGGLDVAELSTQIRALRTVAQILELPDDLTAGSLLHLPGVLGARLLPENPLEVWPLVAAAAQAALEQLEALRKREGAILVDDLLARVTQIEVWQQAIAQLAPAVPQNYKVVLEKRLAELLDEGCSVEPTQIAREVALMADRCDISEELIRLMSHATQMRHILAEGGVCGRTLDFLCQEILREINTIGSKANCAAITRLVISLKAELEAIREQVQNIE